jgi:redox-sensitive bicupin YhaK (pirin superfamily)
MKRIEGYPAPEFDGRVLRVLAHGTVHDVDPFLMLDYFESKETNVGMGSWHPHRGIETFTYIKRGNMKEEDTINGVLGVDEGGALHLSAGSGMFHTSVPTYSEKGIQGFQIWFNIPQKDKMSKPYSASFQNSDFKHIKKDGNDVKVLTGIYEGVKGPLDKSNIGLRMLDVSVDKEIVLEREVFKKGYIYIYSGNGLINDEEELISQSAYILDEGKYHIKNISKEPLQLLFAEGVPLNEPIVWRGPIVMNTKEEIIEAYKDLENDNFVK